MLKSALFSVVAFFAAVTPSAADVCEAVALRTYKSESGYIIPNGQKLTRVTQFVVHNSGKKEFCSHGGGCYPASMFKLTNCKINLANPDKLGDETIYALDVVRSKVPRDRMRREDVEGQLINMGLCNACAGNAAYKYVTSPNSRCGRLTKSALEGNPRAREIIGGDNSPCY